MTTFDITVAVRLLLATVSDSSVKYYSCIFSAMVEQQNNAEKYTTNYQIKYIW